MLHTDEQGWSSPGNGRIGTVLLGLEDRKTMNRILEELEFKCERCDDVGISNATREQLPLGIPLLRLALRDVGTVTCPECSGVAPD